ncbi:MAG: cell division protein FtsQ/DivIB [Chloroflexota bacterium]
MDARTPRRRRNTRQTTTSGATANTRPQTVVTPRSLANSRSATTTRQRRESRSGAARPQPKRNTQAPPPVLVRSGRAVLPVTQRAATQPKRRYDVALNLPGAEVRLPAVPQIQLNWRVGSGLLFLVLAALLFYLWSSPTFRVMQAETSGNRRVSNGDINTVIGVYDESIFSIDPQTIQEQLQRAFPDFKSVSVQVKLPNRVIVTVEERQPVLAWQQGGSIHWVDGEGVSFSPRGEMDLVMIDAKDTPPGTVVDPQQHTTTLDPKWVNTFQKMAEQAPAGVPILYSTERGLGWVDPQGWEAYFGTDFSNMEQKLLVYAALVSRLQQDGIQPSLVSVEYVHAPYYRVEP